MAAFLKPSLSHPISFPSSLSPHPTTKPFLSIICMGGGPRTFPGGVTKWQWKRMQLKRAKQLLSARLARERQIYEMRKRAELKAAVSELEKPWEVVAERAPVLFSVAADEQLKVLADRFLKPGGLDLWSEKDGPQLFDKADDGRNGYMHKEDRRGRELKGRLKGKENSGAALSDVDTEDSSCRSGFGVGKDVHSNIENGMFSKNEGRIIGNGLSSDRQSKGRSVHMENDRNGGGRNGAFSSKNPSKGGSRNGSFRGRGGGGMVIRQTASSRSNFKTRDSVSSDDGKDSDLGWSSSADRRHSDKDDGSRSSGVVGLRNFSEGRRRNGSFNGMGGEVLGNARRQNFQPRNSMNFNDRQDANSGWSSSFQHRISGEDKDNSRSFGGIGSRDPRNGRSRYVSLERRGDGGMRNGSFRQNLKPERTINFDGEGADFASRSSSKSTRISHSKDRSENLKFGRKEAWVRNGL